MHANDLTNETRNALRRRGWAVVIIQQYAGCGRPRGDIVSRHRSYEAAARHCGSLQRIEYL